MTLSPLNRRRWLNFKRNRRGYVSFWLFLVLFFASMASELICNDRPLFALYKGEWLFPVFVNYPEDKFGGFELVTDYRDPTVAQEIDAHGFMIWPPVRFANNTVKRDPPTGLPSPPTWTLSEAQCHGPCSKLEPEWLGTDAVRAIRPDPRRRILRGRRRGGSGSGLFRRPARSHHAARHRDLVVAAAALHPHHPLGDAGAELLDAARHSASVLMDEPRPSGARGVPAHAQL
jgi:hypothetical protein